MKLLKSISPEQAIVSWNNFVQKLSPSPPISFNPSLLHFYSSFFNWKPYYFLIYLDGHVIGVCPIIDTGRKFVSLPHLSYGGILWSEKSRFNSLSLIQVFNRLIIEENPNPGFLKYKIDNQMPERGQATIGKKELFVRSLWDFKGAAKSNKVCSFIQLAETNTKMLKLLNSNLRRKLRKTIANGLEAKQGGIELLDDFYSIYAHNMYRLGSPVYGKSFFKAIFENDKNDTVRIFLSEIKGKAVGAAFLMSYFRFYENTWFSTNRAYKKYLVSDHLHWQMIQYAIENKGEIYSMGRSTQSESVHQYKKHWPVNDKPLYLVDNTKGLQLKNQKWLADIWKKLPYFLTLRLGPVLVRHIY